MIARLVAADVFGPPGVFQPNILGWRLERWMDGPAWINLCIKRNWARALNLVASLYVPRALEVAPAPNLAINLARARELETAARRGLAESFATLAPPQDQDPETPETRVFIPFEIRGSYFP